MNARPLLISAYFFKTKDQKIKRRIMLLDVLPGELSTKEIAGYLSPEIELIVNLPQNGCHAYQAQRHFESVSINIHDDGEILAVAR